MAASSQYIDKEETVGMACCKSWRSSFLLKRPSKIAIQFPLHENHLQYMWVTKSETLGRPNTGIVSLDKRKEYEEKSKLVRSSH